ncbi:branched-chain amino acid ABC transporter [Pelistega sp. NLN82]|uniref:Branched-chain amino acid ABC transporter n=2 Tax=Pelistega ratti TaxID=2652177 RepID=A0A6L9Y6Y4_9BURK|nr:branched-chain amino acid ABC transporter [Pelistega ratti]
MTFSQQIITIGLAVFAVQFCRWLPFIIFPDNRPTPPYIRYLGSILPAAMFGMLVVYCYKDISLSTSPYGLPDFIAGILVFALHLWKRNMFLSIMVGTLFYMFLIQQVFV